MSTHRFAPFAIAIALCLTGCASVPRVVVPTPWGVAGVAGFAPEAAAPRSEIAARIEAQRYAGLVGSAVAEPAAAPAAVVAAR